MRKTKESNIAVEDAPTASLTPAKIYEENALKALRNAGYRITMPRVQVIRALADSEQAMTAYSIHNKIVNETNGKIDVVSVYRILATLVEVGLIHHVGIADGYVACRMENCTNSSLLVLNEATNAITEFTVPQAVLDALNEQATANGFTPQTIRIEIVGQV